MTLRSAAEKALPASLSAPPVVNLGNIIVRVRGELLGPPAPLAGWKRNSPISFQYQMKPRKVCPSLHQRSLLSFLFSCHAQLTEDICPLSSGVRRGDVHLTVPKGQRI